MRVGRIHAQLIQALILTAITMDPIFAQSKKISDASLRIMVLDPAGATIPNARVSINKQTQVSTTNKRGEADFNRLAPGKYQVRVSADGFATLTINDLVLRPENNQIEVRLEVAAVQEEIKVERDQREAKTDPRGDAFATVLTPEQIANLPDDPEEFEEALRQIAGPGATFRVNGFRGGHLPPKNQIREIRFRSNSYAAENHESSFISVDILTKPGIDAWHGSLNFGFRDESLNARNAFAPFRAPEQNRRFGIDLGGPLWKNRTSLFVAADGVNSYEAKTIVAALPQGNFYDQVLQPWRTLNLNARVEHLLTGTHTARVEYQHNATRRDNNGVGNFDFPERGYTTDSAEQILRFADSGAIGKKLFNEFRFQALWQRVDVSSLSSATTILVLNAFNRGGGQINSSRRVREFEVADNVDLAIKKHTMRAGFLFEAANYQSNELRNQNGTFIFSSLEAFNAGRPATYTERLGAGSVDFNQFQFAWYWQNDWRVRKSLTLSFGVRHESQTNLDDKNNFAPRFGFAWSPFKSGKTTIRGGAGVFYDWFASETYEQALRVNGQQQLDLVVLNPCFPTPFACGAPSSLPPSLIQVDPGMKMPYVQQASIGLQQEFPKNLRLITQYFYRHGVHQMRGRNINAPVPGLGRPDPITGNITQIESSSNSFNRTFVVNVNWMKPGKFFLGASYVYSNTTNETDGPLSLPVNNYDLRYERGPSPQDIRHRFFLMSNFTLPLGLRLGTIFQASSALPYNITTGFDDNGDSIVNDRPQGINRNSSRGAGRWDLNLRLGWGFGFGKQPDAQGAGAPQVRILRGGGDAGEMLGSMGSLPGANNKRFRTEFFVQATNLFNHTNLIAFSGVQTSPFFEQATAALPGRRIEMGMRFSF
ncbi:MAG: TonB-dependent receptor [Acidobacteria bacterium]|nr:TonB-dependent receptor [Acidobacteriota bacterium]